MIQLVNSISKRIYKPAASYDRAHASIKLFDSYKLGIFIHWGMTTYIDSIWSSRLNEPPPAVATFTFNGNADTFNTWGQQLAASGKVEYVILTVKHTDGFRIYPITADIEFNGGIQVDGQDDYKELSLPQIADYGTNNAALINSVYQDILTAFCNAMTNNGLKYGFYYNIGYDVNMRGSTSTSTGGHDISPGFDGTGNFRTWYADYKANGKAHADDLYPNFTGNWAVNYKIYIEYVKDQLGYLIDNYNPAILWYDSCFCYPNGFLSELYQYVKGKKPSIIIAANSTHIGTTNYFSGTNTALPPITFSSDYWTTMQDYSYPIFDVISDEMGSLATNLNEYNQVTNHGSKTYYLPKEMLDKVYVGSYWNISSKGSLKSQSTIQTNYNTAKNNACRYCLNLSPDTSGIIEQGQIDLINGLNL